MQRSALCRSRRELSNEYLLAKIGVDTAENEPLEVWAKIIQYYSFVSLTSGLRDKPQSRSVIDLNRLRLYLCEMINNHVLTQTFDAENRQLHDAFEAQTRCLAKEPKVEEKTRHKGTSK